MIIINMQYSRGFVFFRNFQTKVPQLASIGSLLSKILKHHTIVY